MSDLRHEAEACRRLWLAVAEKAVVEACTAIVRRSGALDDAVAREMRYFHSKGWREVCEYAGISYRPDHIERFLKSPDVRTTSAQMRRRRGYLGSFTCFGQAVRQRKKAEAALGYTLRMR